MVRGEPVVDRVGALGPGREFDAVRAMIARWGTRARGIGDDCAVLGVPPDRQLCVSTDSSVENVHFRRDWLTPREIGYRAATAALSDLAAMGAEPLALLLAITVPVDWRDDLVEIADGVGDAASLAGATIIGGDSSSGGELSLTISVLGTAARAIMRSGARAGDVVWVTGLLGGPLAALRSLKVGEEPAAECRARFAAPVARVREGAWLAAHGATALIDVSDGLLADVAHIAAASGVHISVDLERLPRVAGMTFEDAARSGEEYELVLTAPASLDAAAFAARFDVPLTAIGHVSDARAGGGEVEARVAGRRVASPGGHDHFSS